MSENEASSASNFIHEMIDEEIRSLIDTAYDQATEILKGDMEKLHELADYLKKNEKIDGETFEKLMNYDELPRDQALAQAKAEAVELAVAAGAVRDTVEIIEVEDVPLAYYAGNTNRVKIKAAGDLAN